MIGIRMRRPSIGSVSLLLAAALSACTVGPDFVPPTPAAPDGWTGWRSGDPSLVGIQATGAELPDPWWKAFGDPVLDDVEGRGLAGSIDLRTAALRVVQARIQRQAAGAQQGPTVTGSAGMTRQRQSETGASTRLFGVLANGNPAVDPDVIAQALAEPFTLYQAGFDASWEPDLWGRVRRSIEAADAGLAQQRALLDLARLSLSSDLARAYFDLRTTQRMIQLTREDIALLADQTRIVAARARGGLVNHLDFDRQQGEFEALRGQLPGLLEQEGAAINRIGLLIGERPGVLRQLLQAPTGEAAAHALPDFALGLPSEVARRRPDIRAAEARLHQATANIGVATADLYPSIRLGARFGFESVESDRVLEWGSRTWSLGPSLSLPIFDQGRRRSTVRLRTVEQQEAALAFQKTVLQAWQEIDDALTAYNAERQALADFRARARTAADAVQLAQARYKGGLTDSQPLTDAMRTRLQATRQVATSEQRLNTRFATIAKVVAAGYAAR